MSKEYIIYCDESEKNGRYYSNFYGGALIFSTHLEQVSCILRNKKIALNFLQEVKWSKVTHNYSKKYIELMECFFDLIQQGLIKIRIMFTQNIFNPNELSDYHKEHEYFLLYYQFLKHAFGLPHSNNLDGKINIRVYLDKLPNNTTEKTEIFKSYLHGLTNNPAFKKAGIIIPKNQIAEVDSKQHVILQCLDVVLGSMSFRLNDKHLEKIPGKKRRAKRTIAKEKVYAAINKRIRDIYPNFNIGVSTSRLGNPENSWNHQYRHWLLKSNNSTVDISKGKRGRKQKA
jgi:hypothetical protein